MQKESFRARVTAEEFYNSLFSLEARKKELLLELEEVNKQLDKLNKSEISNNRSTIGASRNR